MKLTLMRALYIKPDIGGTTIIKSTLSGLIEKVANIFNFLRFIFSRNKHKFYPEVNTIFY